MFNSFEVAGARRTNLAAFFFPDYLQ